MEQTIDCGIDLGTTNSAIAVLVDGKPEVIRAETWGTDYIPSAVYMDEHGICVGEDARRNIALDPANGHTEFKRFMGTPLRFRFPRVGRELTAEELSAEVLKELLRNARESRGLDIRAAVITVPAAFTTPQSAATRRAAELAGLEACVLLQEPIAAALAYGFDRLDGTFFWLVYDLGAGTFDAAVIRLKDGNLEVVHHGGDNQLGGSHIDRAIIDQVITPVLVREYGITDFGPAGPWQLAYGKLKLAVEEAKKVVSRRPTARVQVSNFRRLDGRGPEIDELVVELTQAQVAAIAGPFIRRTVEVCRRVLKEKGLSPADIERVILVGGPPLAPYMREMLADPNEGLGIPLQYSIDPMTVVARGAAIFAGTQKFSPGRRAPAPGRFSLQLEYDPIGPDDRPVVVGRVWAEGISDFSGYAVQFTNPGARPPWSGPKVPVGREGAFTATLLAQPGPPNEFKISLFDPAGREVPVEPDRLSYMVGATITTPPLTHSIGIATANNRVDLLFEKGTPLPARRRVVYQQVFPVRQGDPNSAIRIPVVEGESMSRADRNFRIGSIEIPGTKLRRDVPAGTEVEVTVEVDASRLITVRAYIPLTGDEYEGRFEGWVEIPGPQVLRDAVAREKERLRGLRERAARAEELELLRELDRVAAERLVEDLDANLAAAADPTAAITCYNRLLELRRRLDEVEDRLEWPELVRKAEETLEGTRAVALQVGTPEEVAALEALERDLRSGIGARLPDVVNRKATEILGLQFRILARFPQFWLDLLAYLETRIHRATDQSTALMLAQLARQAAGAGNWQAMRVAVFKLWELFPPEVAAEAQAGGYGGTLGRQA